MTPFEHVLVLISIVIGFAVTTLLGGIVRLVHRRGVVIWYWPSALWMFTLLLLDLQVWWSQFSWRKLASWTFFGFFAMLLVPIGAYALSALLVAEPDETPIDMRSEYFSRRRVFFGILIATIAASYLPNVATGTGLGNTTDDVAKAGIMLINVPALLSSNERLHKGLAVFGVAVVCTYIGLLFANL